MDAKSFDFDKWAEELERLAYKAYCKWYIEHEEWN